MKKLLLIPILLLQGCVTIQEVTKTVEPDSPNYAPPAINYMMERQSSGSLYSGRGGLSLYQDRRAYRVGDVLTVNLEEKTRSGKTASASFAKKSSAALSAPSVGTYTLDDLAAAIDGSRAFDGSASASQNNSLTGAITVMVHEVMPNGVLRISGEKWLSLNQGDEYIRLTGLVRVDDINADNTLSSERIADARITYSGEGSLANANEPGWFMKILNSKWMPF
ncbi:flagellar basal body L-ring protein (plasmid) [Vibrio breoganii]|uniref:Flagellar L-ring protein n=1 Tax=Vibrio breoganii TaxID=553239 RepID=A0AAN0XZ75_9VIBR|nr:flagellar basal body L-ring protein FlgH [Vibrio breoganii]ANO35293.1 flagellar basal body L-ring protein [Vibrio breoganii]